MKTESRVTEPTRRPWEIYDFDGQVKHYPKTIIVAPTGESICEIAGGWPKCTLAENEANAALIVRAVNNHDALVEALQLLQGFDWKLDDSAHAQEIKRRAEAALAAAQETK